MIKLAITAFLFNSLTKIYTKNNKFQKFYYICIYNSYYFASN